ncbi:MAG: autotransporter assembly complex family protein [Halieaceae bacterium]|jgi:translocation and assembly module TamA|nr:autotransporter assembly complex family protein [Halieaceae bacterium]
MKRRAAEWARWCLFTLLSWSGTCIAGLEIDVMGEADARLRSNIEAFTQLDETPCDAPRWLIRRQRGQLDEQVKNAVRALGYYRPVIESALAFEDTCWRVTLTVDPGERTLVSKRRILINGDMANDPAFESLLAVLPLVEGDPIDHGRYERIKSRLRNFALERGYFDFSITRSVLLIADDLTTAEIDIAANSGSRYHLGEISLSAAPLDADFLRRLADLPTGAGYDARALVAATRNLEARGYFSRVDVRADIDGRTNGVVPVDITLEPAARHAWRFGAGFATDSGPRGGVRFENRRVNKEGHRFDAELRVSQLESGLTADYQMPGFDPHKSNYSVSLGALHEDTASATSDSAKLVFRHTLTDSDWTRTRFLELLHESSDFGDAGVNSNLVMPGIGINRVRADDILRTRRGHRINIELRGASEAMLSSTNLLQIRTNGKWIRRFGDAGRVVARAELGVTWVDDFSALPASVRFFAGGDNSVRGYDFDALGPADDRGNVIGGRHLLTAGLDYEYPVKGEDWWLAVFADAGDAFNDTELDLRTGAGVGFRWYSPLGRLKVDIARPNERSDDSWRLHISLGVDL